MIDPYTLRAGSLCDGRGAELLQAINIKLTKLDGFTCAAKSTDVKIAATDRLNISPTMNFEKTQKFGHH